MTRKILFFETKWERTGEIIHKLEIESEDTEFRKEIQQFSVQILQNPLKFSPCGFIDLGFYFIRDVSTFEVSI